MNKITETLPFMNNKSRIIFRDNTIIHFNRTTLYEYNKITQKTKRLYNTETESIQQVFLFNNKIYFSTLNSLRIIEGGKLKNKLDFDTKILKTAMETNCLYVLTENCLIKIFENFKREIITYGEFLNFTVDNSKVYVYSTNGIMKITGLKKIAYKITEDEEVELEYFESINNLLFLGYKTVIDVYTLKGIDHSSRNRDLEFNYRMDMTGVYELNYNKNKLLVYNQQGVFTLTTRPHKILNEVCQFINGDVAIINDSVILLTDFSSQMDFKDLNMKIKETNKNTFKSLKDIQIEVINLFSPLLNLYSKEDGEFKVEYIYQLTRILLQIQCIQKMIPGKLETLRSNFNILSARVNTATNTRSSLLNKIYKMYEEFSYLEEKYKKMQRIREYGKDFLEKYKAKIKDCKQFEVEIKSQNSVLREIIRKL